MRTTSERGTTFLELLVVLGIISVVAGMVIPQLSNALDRNKVFTGSELVAAAIRSGRLSAITRNMTYQVRFDCPAVGAVKVLVMTGDPVIDNDVNRCSTTLGNDGPTMFMPDGVSYGNLPTIEINGRGRMSTVPGGGFLLPALPLGITVSYENFTRTITVSPTGRVITPS